MCAMVTVKLFLNKYRSFFRILLLQTKDDYDHLSGHYAQKICSSKIQVKFFRLIDFFNNIFVFVSSPNSYRVISENVPEFESIPDWYGHERPEPLYTNPNPADLPAQALEPRNNPHAARKVDMVYTNAATFNAPVGMMRTDNVQKEESRWWDWSQPKAEPYGPKAISQEEWKKTNESSYRNAFHLAGESGPYAKKNTRYSANPHRAVTVGIGMMIFFCDRFRLIITCHIYLISVPITELKVDHYDAEPRTLVERVSFEQQYNSRNDTNYPLRGRVSFFHFFLLNNFTNID